MALRGTDPRRLGVEGFAREGGGLQGEWDGAGFARLRQSVHPLAPAQAPVAFRADGEVRKRSGVDPQSWLRIQAHTSLTLVCQRCLGPLETTLTVDRWLRFVRGEEAAEALDAQVEEDVLDMERPVDLHQLVEDELILALPLVPRHEQACPDPLPLPEEVELDEPERPPHPFAPLAALKRAR